MSGRVLHIEGPYEGEEIDTIVEMDPEYILEVAATTPGHGISEAALARARQILDEPEPWLDDDDDEEIQALHFGRSRYEYE